LSTEDEECLGRPTQVTVPENVDGIHSTILDDQRISAEKIAETVICSIIHEILYVKRLSVKWIPECLNAVQKCD
jgi:hypothetical protein